MSERSADYDAARCPYVNDFYRDPPTRMREDGWRCGMETGHVNGHTLYDADGERVLDRMGPWRVIPPATRRGQRMSTQTPDPTAGEDVEALAEAIREGVKVHGNYVASILARDVARAVLASDWLAARESAAATRARTDERERIAQAIEANWSGDLAYDLAIEDAARIARAASLAPDTAGESA